MVEMRVHSVWSRHQYAQDERLRANRTALMRSGRLLERRGEFWHTSEVTGGHVCHPWGLTGLNPPAFQVTSYSLRMVNLWRKHSFQGKVWISTKVFQDESILLTFSCCSFTMWKSVSKDPYQQVQKQCGTLLTLPTLFLTLRQYLFLSYGMCF